MNNLKRKHVNMYELINCFTDAADLANPRLTNHHQEAAYMAYHIADHMGLPLSKQQEVVLAGLLHDIGAVSTAERISIVDNDDSDNVQEHAHKGADILEQVSYLKNAANIIRYHHVRWDNGKGSKFEGEEVPLLSNILYLADRAVVKLDKDRPVIGGRLAKLKSHLSSENLSLGSRVMAVADIFTAITEDRPYRKGMDKTRALRVLNDMVKAGSICGLVVSMLEDNYDEINNCRINAQKGDC